jgi:hypothetical protein
MEKVRGASPGDLPAYKATLDRNGRWTQDTSNFMQAIDPKISAWEDAEARRKAMGNVIRADSLNYRTDVNAQTKLEVQKMADATRTEISQSTLDWKSKHQLTRSMPFIEHAELAEIKGDLANINMLTRDMRGMTGKNRDEAQTEIQNSWIRYHNKWDTILKNAADKADKADGNGETVNPQTQQSSATPAPAGPAANSIKSKVERANAIANEHPDWTKEQVLKELNQQPTP